jgi:hypothetical protein
MTAGGRHMALPRGRSEQGRWGGGCGGCVGLGHSVVRARATDMRVPATVPCGLIVRSIQTGVQMISNKFKTNQISFNPKMTFPNSKNFK